MTLGELSDLSKDQGIELIAIRSMNELLGIDCQELLPITALPPVIDLTQIWSEIKPILNRNKKRLSTRELLLLGNMTNDGLSFIEERWGEDPRKIRQVDSGHNDLLSSLIIGQINFGDQIPPHILQVHTHPDIVACLRLLKERGQEVDANLEFNVRKLQRFFSSIPHLGMEDVQQALFPFVYLSLIIDQTYLLDENEVTVVGLLRTKNTVMRDNPLVTRAVTIEEMRSSLLPMINMIVGIKPEPPKEELMSFNNDIKVSDEFALGVYRGFINLGQTGPKYLRRRLGRGDS